MLVIFGLSGDSSSGQRSYSLFAGLEELLGPDYYQLLAVAHQIFRKLCHVFEYAVLFGLWRGGGLTGLQSLLVCTLFAAGDEYHQSFVYKRLGCWSDVLLDALSAALMWRLEWRWRRIRKNSASDNSQRDAA